MLVRPRGDQGWILEESPPQRFSPKSLFSSLCLLTGVKRPVKFVFPPVAQVVSAATNFPSPSSPPTAGCGLSSAAAATGWEKVSLLFMRVSASPHPVY